MVCQFFANAKTPPPKELSVFTAVIMAVLSVVAVGGNAAVVATIWKDPLSKLRNPFNHLLLNLALSDLLLGAVSMPVGVVAHVQEYREELSVGVAKTLHMTIFISGTASLLSLIAMSIDRLVAITCSTKYTRLFTLRRCAVISVGIWVFSCSFPFLYFAWDYIGYMMFFTHSAIFVALLILIVVQVRIRSYLRAHSNQMTENIGDAPSASRKAAESKEEEFQRKISRVYLIILAFFVSIYVPSVVMIYILHFCESCDCTFRHVLRDLSFVLVCANSCVNPFIYALRVKQFRKSIKAVFCCWSQAAKPSVQGSKPTSAETVE